VLGFNPYTKPNMKSNIFLLAVAALSFAACNNKPAANTPETVIDTVNHTGSVDSSGNATNSGVPMDTAKVMMTDSLFLTNAYQVGKFEVAAGKLAQTKSSDAKVKEFAAMMVADHTAMGKDIESQAAQEKIALPADMGKDLTKEYDKLKGLSGKAFDKEYASVNVKGHKETIEKFEKASGDPNDSPEVQNLAKSALPKLKAHKEHADMLKEETKM